MSLDFINTSVRLTSKYVIAPLSLAFFGGYRVYILYSGIDAKSHTNVPSLSSSLPPPSLFLSFSLIVTGGLFHCGP